MPIESPQHQTPSVMNCPMLQIVTGCTHNECHFCDIFQNVDFKMIDMDTISADLDELAKTIRPDQHRINLTGGNPYALPVKRLVPILDLIKEKLPGIDSFGGFCRIADIGSKSDEDLELLASYGVDDLSIGAESGYDPALEFMEKGHSSKDVIEQSRRMHDVGMDFTLFYLAGMAGKGKGQDNARASAKVYSAASPGHILIVTITPTPTWPLKKDIEAGLWEAPDEIEIVEEVRTFIEGLDCKTYVNSSHDTDVVRFEGMVPKDQSNMLALIDDRLPKINPKAARKMREFIHKATF